MSLRILLPAAGACLLGLSLTVPGQPSPLAMKTEALPPDGGEVGQAYAEFASAVDAGDQARIARYVDSALADKGPAFLQAFGKLVPRKPIGGRRQGDRATLFLQTAVEKGGGPYQLWNATLTPAGWHFDGPEDVVPFGIPDPGLDCKGKTKFPCATSTAPDSIVSGGLVLNKYDTFVFKKAPAFRLLDGFAVRNVDEDSKALKSTTIFLSSTGIMPGMLTREVDDPNSVRYKLTSGLLRLDVAADGKSAHVEFWDHNSRKQGDVSAGLSIDTADGKRIRGALKADITDMAKVDVVFDLGTASVSY